MSSQSVHAQAIWDASVKFLSSAVKELVDASKGMNEEGLYNGANVPVSETVEQLIMKNTLLKIQQRHELTTCLNDELKDLLT